MRHLIHVCVVAVTITSISARVEGQTLNGTVIDRGTELPLSGVSLQLLDASRATVAVAATDSNGFYSFALQEAGTYSLLVRAWGYELSELRSLDVFGDYTIDVWMDATTAARETFELHGVVLNDSTREPIADASVVLLDNGGAIVQGTISDVGGLYAMPSPGAGLYALRVDGADFKTVVTQSFEVADNQNVSVEVRLSKRTATELSPITVTADAPIVEPLPLREFHRRRERGLGNFLTREEIEQRQPQRFSDALRMLPMIRVVPMPPDADRPFGPRSGRHTVRIRGLSNRIGGYEGCPPVIYLDGIKLGSIDDAEYGGPDLLVFPHDIEGVEVYGPATVPAEYGGSDAGCGVVVVWKRRY